MDVPISPAAGPGDPGDLDALGALAEPNRRALYEAVTRAGGWISRDEAAAVTGLQRGVTAHHLDRLVDDGLLEIQFRRLTGRSGPGAGRPAKLYRRARREMGVTLPPRDYELVARLLADAVARARAAGGDVDAALVEEAREEGRRISAAAVARRGRRRSAAASVEALLHELRSRGFEPEHRAGDVVVLRNCPFHHLAQRHTEMVCGLNHAMLRTTLDELGGTGLEARLEPDPETCCVRLRPSP